MARVTRVGRVPVDSTSEAEGKATLTGSLVNVYELWMAEEWLGIWGIAGFGTGASDLTTVGGGIPEESLLSWLDALLSGLVELGARLDGGDAQRGLGAEAGAELRFTHTGIGLGLAGRVRMLLVHEDPEVREWGASATLTWEPPDRGPGPSVSVAPAWGRPASGMHALWPDPQAVLASRGGPAHAGPAQAGDRSSWVPDTVDLTVGYRLDGLELEVFGRHRTGSGDAGYRFGFGGSPAPPPAAAATALRCQGASRRLRTASRLSTCMASSPIAIA